MEKIGLVRTRDGKSFLVPFILITSLFFLWGVAHSILDVLNKHFQDTLEITRTRSALIQAVVYGGYFIMALPAGLHIPADTRSAFPVISVQSPVSIQCCWQS